MVVLESREAAAMKSRRVSGVIIGVPACWIKDILIGETGIAAGDDAEECISLSVICDVNFSCVEALLVGPRTKGSWCFAAFLLRQNSRRANKASKKTKETPTETPTTTPLDVDWDCVDCGEAAEDEDADADTGADAVEL